MNNDLNITLLYNIIQTMTIGYVYKLVCKDINAKEIYIGSTMNINQRRRAHKNRCNDINDKCHNIHVYQYIRQNGGWENWESIIVETFEYNEKYELKNRERFHLEQLQAKLNKQIPNRTDVEYRSANIEQIAHRDKQYRDANKEHIKQHKGLKHMCECGVEYTHCHKSRHEKSKKHLAHINKPA